MARFLLLPLCPALRSRSAMAALFWWSPLWQPHTVEDFLWEPPMVLDKPLALLNCWLQVRSHKNSCVHFCHLLFVPNKSVCFLFVSKWKLRHQTSFRDYRVWLLDKEAKWDWMFELQESLHLWWSSIEREQRFRALLTFRLFKTETFTVCWLPRPSQKILELILSVLLTAVDVQLQLLSCLFRVRFLAGENLLHAFLFLWKNAWTRFSIIIHRRRRSCTCKEVQNDYFSLSDFTDPSD